LQSNLASLIGGLTRKSYKQETLSLSFSNPKLTPKT